MKEKLIFIATKIHFRKYAPFIFGCILVLVPVVVLLSRPSTPTDMLFDDRDFTKGVLAINTDKTSYAPGETVLFGMGSLDPKGSTLCSSYLQLEIRALNHKEVTTISTANTEIVTTPTCGENNVTNEPDYTGRYTIPASAGTGKYDLILTNLDSGKKVASSFTVNSRADDIQISRYGATRINPFKADRYPMTIKVTAAKDFQGQLTETVPATFKIIWQGPAKVSTVKDIQTLTWDVGLKAGETKEFSYDYQAPQVSPDFIKLGKAKLTSGLSTIIDPESWQIASDATITTAGSGNWSSTTPNAPWSGGTLPGAADNVTIANGHTLTLDGAGGNRSVLYIIINAGGTLAFSGTPTLTLTSTTSARTFIANSGTYTSNGAETILINVTTPAGNQTMTSGTVAMQNLTITSNLGTARTYTLGASSSINGNLSIAPSGAGNVILTVSPAANYVVGGDITLTSVGSANNRATLDLTASNRTLSAKSISIGSYAIFRARGGTTTLTGTGTTTLFTNNGTFTRDTSTIRVGSTSGTPTLFAGATATTFATLTINPSAGVVVNSGVAFTIGTAMNVTTGVFNISAAITGPGAAAGTFTVASTLCLGGGATNTSTTCDNVATSGSAITMPAFLTYTFTDSTIMFLSNADTSIQVARITYNNLTFNPVLSGDHAYTFAGAATINGDFDIDPSGTANRLTVSMGGNLTVATTKTTYIRSSGGSATSTLSTIANTNALSSGFINIAASGTLTAITTSAISLTGITGTLFTKDASGTFNQATSTVNVTSATGPVTLLSTAVTFHILTINSAAINTVVNPGDAITTDNAAGNMFYVQSGVFNLANQTITPGTSGTLRVGANGTFCLGGTTGGTTATCDSGATQTSASTFPAFTTITLDSGSTVVYLANAAQTVPVTQSYSNIKFTPVLTAGVGNIVYTMGGAMTTTGSFTINPSGTANSLTVNMAGAITVPVAGTTTIQGSGSATSILDVRPSSTDWMLTTGLLNLANGGTLDATSATTTILTLNGTSGTLFILSGTGTFTITSGTPTVVISANGTPTAITSGAITFYNLSLTPALATLDRAYAFGTGAITINGDFTIQPSGSHLLTVTMGSGGITVDPGKTTNITRSNTATSNLATGTGNGTLSTGTLTVALGGTLDGTGSSSTITLTATSGTPFTPTGTFTPGSTTVSYAPASGTAITVGSTTYHNVTFNHTGTTFSLTTGGIYTDSGGVLTITTGVLDTVSGSNYQITVGGNWTNSVGTGGFLAQSGTVTFNQSATAQITGTTTFYNFTCATAGKTLQFGAGTTFTFGGLLTLTGSAGPSYVTLTSTTGSSSWTIKHLGTESITYASIAWSACDGSSTTISADDGTSNNGGNNGTCWVFAPTYATSYTSLPIPRLRWNFDDASGTTVGDNTTLTNTGTIANATWQVTSDNATSNKRSIFLRFDGTGDYVTRASDPDFNFGTGSFAVTGWFRHPTAASGTQTILSRATAVNGVGYKVYMDSSGHICFGIDASAGSFPNDSACTTQTYAEPTWHHFAAVKNGTTDIRIYLDGRLATTTTGITSGSLTAVAALYVGTDVDGSTNGWVGDIDSIEMYPDVLSANQIAADMLDPSSVLFGASSTDPLTNGLVGWWKMDETATPSTDSSENGYSGTWHGTAAAASGKFGNSITLDGNSDYVETASVDTTTASWTMSAWIYPTSIPGGDTSIVYTISRDKHLKLSGSELEGCYYEDGTYTWRCATTSSLNAQINTWYHVVYTRDYDSEISRIFVNGELKGSYQALPGTNSAEAGSNPIQIGTDQWNQYFPGRIDEVRMYNRALSPKEAVDLYNWAPSPIGYWKMDEGSWTNDCATSTVLDSSGNNQNMVSCPNGTGPKGGADGKFGKAGKFDGSDDRTYIANDGGTFAPSIVTVGAWINASSGAGPATIFYRGADNGDYHTYRLYLQSNYLAVDYTGDPYSQEIFASTSTYTWTNGWHYVAFSYTRGTGSSMKLYLDGVNIPGSWVSGNGNVTAQDFTQVYIGYRGTLYTEPFTGSIDDVKVYNYARTTKQIMQDMNAGHPTGGSPVGSQTAYWKFDEQQGQTLNNSVPNTITAVRGTTSGTDSTDPSWLLENSCKLGGCLSFDGSTQVATVTNTTAIDFDNNLNSGFTIAAWIYPTSAGEGSGGRVFYKGTNTWLRVDTLSGGKLDIEGSLDLATTDATLNVSAQVTQNAWNYVAMSYTDDADDEITIWVNGRSVGTSTNGVGSLASDTNDLLIGGNSSNNFAGRIDEFKIYNSELSQSEILLDMNANSTAAVGGVVGTHDNESFSGNPPVGWYKMDENTGTTTTVNSSGGTNNGTFANMNDSGWVSGKSGSAVYFNGNDSTPRAVQLPDDAFNSLTQGTISTWFKLNDTGDDYQDLWGLGKASSPGAQWHELYYRRSTNTISYSATGCSSGDFSVDTPLPDPQTGWHYVALTVNSSGNAFYIDGVKTSPTYSAGDATGNCFFSKFPTPVNYRIGCWTNSFYGTCYTPELFEGTIDNFKIYDYALSPAQIAYDFNRGAPVAWYKMDECTGGTIHSTNDPYNSALNGTINLGSGGTQTTTIGTGSCTTGASTPWYNGRIGKYTSSLNFDGTDDYAEIPDNAILRPGYGDWTISAWINPPNTDQTGTIISKAMNSNPYTGYAIGIGAAPSNNWGAGKKLIFSFLDSNSHDRGGYTNRDIADGNWHHITVVSNMSTGDNIYAYVDGRQEAITRDYQQGTWDTINNTDPLDIGMLSSNSIWYFNGQIDDVRMYNYALTSDMVKKLYNEGSAVRFGPDVKTLALQPDATAGIDTILDLNSPNTNNGTATDIELRGNTALTGLIKFDLTSIPSNATITSATLNLYSDYIYATRTDNVYRILAADSSWTETGATWNYAVASTTRWAGDTGNNGGSDAGCSVGGTDYSSTSMGSWTPTYGASADTKYSISLNLTEFNLMRTNNYGMALVAPWDININAYRSSDYSTDATKRPQLIVTYTTN